MNKQTFVSSDELMLISMPYLPYLRG